MSLSDAEAEALADFCFEMCEKYDLPFTNNTPRVQDGVQLHPIGDFSTDVFGCFLDLIEKRGRE